jgi:hypothetical protein
VNGLLFGLAGAMLLGSALLSAAEQATFSVGASRLRTLREEGFRGAETLQAVRDQAPAVRAAVFLANSLLNGLAVGLLVLAASVEWGFAGRWWRFPSGSWASWWPRESPGWWPPAAPSAWPSSPPLSSGPWRRWPAPSSFPSWGWSRSSSAGTGRAPPPRRSGRSGS